ncbi:MAG: c-type cytochrome [Burkholderiales bacterium]
MKAAISLALAGVVLAAQPARAAQEDVQARSWAATCTGCHGTDGRSQGGIPGIAGLDKAYIVSVMQEYKADKRAATVMHQHAKGYSDAQIERIAAFFASQKR